ncbi:MAG: glucose 1-dehydrogenase [Bacteroidota bacterium]
MSEFTHQVALVTGGASGIGRATAIAFAKKGAAVVIADLQAIQGQETKKMIIQAGGEALFVQTDVTQIEAVQNLVSQTLRVFGKLNYVCNSAGLQTYGTVESTDETTWDKTFEVGVKSIYLVSKFSVPEIRKQGGGAIVNITSVQGIRSQPNVSAYAASKGAVIALTRSMAMDYAKENIRVNAICPGSIDTPLLRFGAAEHGPLEEVLQDWGAKHPIGRIGKPEEIAETAMFLCSPQASFIHGQSIVVDGGLSIGLL